MHYPREYEAWARRAAERLESIRDAVSKEVGFTPPQTIDVLVMNPVAEPNGVAWPLLDTPRMIFFAEPPGPDEQLGAYGHWIDLLAVHETAHLVHMLRPSRNPLQPLRRAVRAAAGSDHAARAALGARGLRHGGRGAADRRRPADERASAR